MRNDKAPPAEHWLDVLKAEVAANSQRHVANRLGVSPSMVNQVLKGKYTGDVEGFRGRVEGAYMAAEVRCPLIGMLPRDVCLEYQNRKPYATNPLRVALGHTCPTCPNNRSKSRRKS